MVVALIMVTVWPGREKIFYEEVKKLQYIKDVYHVFGEFDFVVIIDAPNLSEINSTVDKIRSLEGVTRTQTIIGAEI
ncbi:MAG: Lrp/AsnC ligand binding domain-containing protein [Archaeoglobaceae archaeon]|nr:Lrp/AsnC ligand binding domain-containing protein [Archaeoglobaceae archaeon]MCX8152188.1 Lrp/AsnC ligand binding domain-containing protein [Archaeoglobaceae archaeon]MDW8013904.1 Lrp/AsnC ligand binding domain-containing protein [Archaeoglobaceae archaeon]